MKNSNAQKHPQVTPEAVNVISRLTHPRWHTQVSVQVCCQQSYSQSKQRSLEKCSHTGVLGWVGALCGLIHVWTPKSTS